MRDIEQLGIESGDAASIQLSGMTTANLSATAGPGQTSFVVDASGFSAGPANVTVSGSANAIVFGGTAGNDALTIAAGTTGTDVLIGNGPFDTLTDNGSGDDILIGAGAGGDTLTGNGNDILVSGSTKYDSDTSANITALDAILAEWASSDSYSMRINNIMSGSGGLVMPGSTRAHHHSRHKRAERCVGWHRPAQPTPIWYSSSAVKTR